MNIVPLAPVAVAALETVVQGVGDILGRGGAFADLLSNRFQGRAEVGTAKSDGAPQSSGLGQQVKRDALRQQFEKLREQLHEQLAQRFAEQGISMSEPVVLAAGGPGRVLEAGNHWDRAAIEGLMESDAQLRDLVTQLLKHGSALWDSGPVGALDRSSGTPRLVVSETEVFFQVV